MKREKELIKNTIILSIGQFLPKLLSFITIPILTAMLTKNEYGSYDLIDTLIMLFIPIATLQLQSAAFRFLIDYRKNTEKTSEIISTILVFTVSVALISSILIQFVFPSVNLNLRILISVYFFADTIYLTLGQIVRGIGNNKDYTVAAIFLSIINTLGIIILVKYASMHLFGVILSLALSNIISILYLLFKTKIYKYFNYKNFSSITLKEMLNYSWPMIPNNLSSWVLRLSDRIFITIFLGIEVNAIYAVANKIPNILMIAQSVMVMAWQENAAIAMKDDDKEEYYSKMLEQNYSFITCCTALLIAALPVIFQILIRGDYGESYLQIPILLLSSFFYIMSSYFGGIYIAYKKTLNIGITTLIAALINLIIDISFLNIIGIWAGSLSTLVAYCFLYYYRLINIQKFQKINCNIKKQFFQLLILILMIILSLNRNIVCNLVNVIISLIISYIFGKNFIHKFMNLSNKGRENL